MINIKSTLRNKLIEIKYIQRNRNFEKNFIKIGDRLEFIFGAFDVNIFYAEINKPHLDKKMK